MILFGVRKDFQLPRNPQKSVYTNLYKGETISFTAVTHNKLPNFLLLALRKFEKTSLTFFEMTKDAEGFEKRHTCIRTLKRHKQTNIQQTKKLTVTLKRAFNSGNLTIGQKC